MPSVQNLVLLPASFMQASKNPVLLQAGTFFTRQHVLHAAQPHFQAGRCPCYCAAETADRPHAAMQSRDLRVGSHSLCATHPLLHAGLMQASVGPAQRLRQLVIDLEAPKLASSVPAAAAAATTSSAAGVAGAGSSDAGSGTAAGTGAACSRAVVARLQQPALGACDGRLVAVRDGTCLPDLHQLNENQRAAVMQ